jgi:hypothetical protein
MSSFIAHTFSILLHLLRIVTSDFADTELILEHMEGFLGPGIGKP